MIVTPVRRRVGIVIRLLLTSKVRSGGGVLLNTVKFRWIPNGRRRRQRLEMRRRRLNKWEDDLVELIGHLLLPWIMMTRKLWWSRAAAFSFTWRSQERRRGGSSSNLNPQRGINPFISIQSSLSHSSPKISFGPQDEEEEENLYQQLPDDDDWSWALSPRRCESSSSSSSHCCCCLVYQNPSAFWLRFSYFLSNEFYINFNPISSSVSFPPSLSFSISLWEHKYSHCRMTDLASYPHQCSNNNATQQQPFKVLARRI